MISRSKESRTNPDKIGTIADLVDTDLLQLLEESTRTDPKKDQNDTKKIKIRIKKS